MDYINIPEDRLGVLIGPKGFTKRRLEKRSNCKLKVEGQSVSVDGEGLDAWKAKDVVQAIGRGFNPDIAFLLFNEEFVFELINLTDYGTDKSLNRLRGRVIGQEGKIRKFIQKNTGAMVCVYGKTVSLIGKFDDVAIAIEGIRMILSGSRYGAVRRFIERENKRRFAPELPK